ncbi:EF-P lysine aminoacylase GenX [Candidatus Gottesmanbacteria bacterium RIFCSPLOWO2_01_FULL_46_21]|uniref:EF-P lysine aminoacylase GenX n=1 Tax=Candidatus Gottesmanbacteria bacterium RIFCSPLOWO2_01_FULL_46_21 TaxID=1798393 RepID=A0A1F6AWQ1_9BACT|nr:MAG: EF-P lysine aminoacylase GenX [Candidatus Gottesmanbacteria bacterium RIFCSPLOWO2_01_FULL_46_21]
MRTWRKLKENPNLWDQYFVREKIIKSIRVFFDTRGFHEVETPLLITNPPAESYLDVFETTLLDRYRNQTKAYLSTSPEVPLKKLMVAGIGNCYSLTKSFRNMETQGNLHNPEFTILEWYRIGATYIDIMKDCEELLFLLSSPAWAGDPGKKNAGFRVKPGMTNIIIYQGKTIDLSVPWDRTTVAQAFAKWAHIDLDIFFDNAKEIAHKKGYQVEPNTTWEQLYNQIFLNEIEPHLGFGKPTFLYDFPAAMGALAKKKKSDPRIAERFELYIAGLELGDCYSELTDWKEQEERFKHELTELKRLGKTTYDYDHDFIEALKIGLPECSGIAVGVDRLVMLLADITDIADTMFFPAEDLFSVHSSEHTK